MSNHQLSQDTQGILLLCGSFGKSRNHSPQPLSLTEYNLLAAALRSHQMTPAHLLAPDGEQKLCSLNHSLDNQRIIELLQRGFLLTLSLEKWRSQGLWIVSRSDRHYPQRLKQHLKYLSPPILYGVGNLELLNKGGLAIVGSRNVNEAVLSYTQQLAHISAQQNIQVISGGARGIDKCGMLSCLEAGGTTIGVLANSLGKASLESDYRQSLDEDRLALISPYDPEAGFHVGNAMGRNKYIYALADYAVVISASFNKGGTWSGAVEALKKLPNIPVFVCQNSQNQGNMELLKLGAKPFPEMSGKLDLLDILKPGETEDAVEVEQMALDFAVNLTPENPAPTPIYVDVNPTPTEAPNVSPSPELSEAKIDVSMDIYQAVLPIILTHLQEPIDAKNLAKLLDVQYNQIQAWLKRAIEDGKVTKLTKPVRYVSSECNR
ncbi:MAG: DNA-processing protein DprA [Arthrospira platensis PCC 7345]|uniref:DNA-processing protein DprA n=1 Tax=Limnospira platensis TaxID=118562 RepID=UPI0028E0F3F7|nr:DNA-processing protein DprA [Arthrospira platensis PCC 7345]